VIKETAAFQKIIRDAVEAAEKKSALITIGIRTASAHPGFGTLKWRANSRQTRSLPIVRFARNQMSTWRIFYSQRNFPGMPHVGWTVPDNSHRV